MAGRMRAASIEGVLNFYQIQKHVIEIWSVLDELANHSLLLDEP
jgi:hypothetical protein